MEPEESVVVVASDRRWPDEFREIAVRLRSALGSRAFRIDHIGSTSVPGLDAKPVLDLQVSVASLEPDRPYREALESLGYVLQVENTDRSKRFFREPPGTRRTHIHVRRAGSFDEQLNLLLRDYLRSHPPVAREYAREKHALAEWFRHDRDAYVRAKAPVVWKLLQEAHDWVLETGWMPGPSDA